jgi:hypothetical protein
MPANDIIKEQLGNIGNKFIAVAKNPTLTGVANLALSSLTDLLTNNLEIAKNTQPFGSREEAMKRYRAMQRQRRQNGGKKYKTKPGHRPAILRL